MLTNTDHSAFDAHAFLIEANGKTVIYSGDIRDHGRKPGVLDRLIKSIPNKPDVLVLEGTLFGRKYQVQVTEKDLEQKIVKELEQNNGLVLVSCSSQNVDRLVTLFRCCKRTGRLFVVDPYTALILERLKKFAKVPYPSDDYKELKILFSHWISTKVKDRYGKEELNRLSPYKITRQEIDNAPNSVMLMLKNSMMPELRKLKSVDNKCLLIYSMWEGYMKQEKSAKLLEYLKGRGVKIAQHHTSGHGTVSTLTKIVDSLNPKVIIPIHTEHPEKFQVFKASIKLLDDGEVFDL